MKNNIAFLLRNFLADSEKLKTELRHSYLSDGRTESVAEHVWRMSLLALMVEPYLKQKINVERFLKIIIVHDLVEIYAGDIPITESVKSEQIKKLKEINEIKAIEKIKTKLPSLIGESFYDLWWEYEKNETIESRVAHALDKIEAQAQHNEAGIDTWVEEEYHFAYKLSNYTTNEKILEELSDILIAETDELLNSIGYHKKTI
ncbi:HD domain-containing protein [Aquimarina muelleri]|uniref:Haloacid dehalogenase n=1 Tax=Aquimarina muelleri TaxID=279356 RepID=A0A918JS12_9FLAO|nr:HD domain-containing protein [Aquimarina muelleri]MCX2762032.1 HD domain-containing protein [Aquimarina muelleri]GGX03950.1 haloacid dehalogenase [Aquimarina muelleri]